MQVKDIGPYFFHQWLAAAQRRSRRRLRMWGGVPPHCSLKMAADHPGICALDSQD